MNFRMSSPTSSPAVRTLRGVLVTSVLPATFFAARMVARANGARFPRPLALAITRPRVQVETRRTARKNARALWAPPPAHAIVVHRVCQTSSGSESWLTCRLRAIRPKSSAIHDLRRGDGGSSLSSSLIPAARRSFATWSAWRRSTSSRAACSAAPNRSSASATSSRSSAPSRDLIDAACRAASLTRAVAP